MMRFRKTVHLAGNILLSLFFMVTAVLALPAAAGCHPYVVTSGSMEPSIPVGSVVYVKPVSLDQLREGMVITFSLPSGSPVVTHRIFRTDRSHNRVFTKGDANQSADILPVYEKQIIGKTVWCIRGIGPFLFMAGRSEGKILILTWACILLTVLRWIDPGREEKR